MALDQCKECGKDVSSKASVCPHCGAPGPKSDAEKAAQGFGCLVIIALVAGSAAFCSFTGGSTDGKKASVETMPVLNPNTNKIAFDLMKPLYLIPGHWVCPSLPEFRAMRQKAPNQCAPIFQPYPAVEIARDGIFDPAFKVRFKGIGKSDDYWVGVGSLSNEIHDGVTPK